MCNLDQSTNVAWKAVRLRCRKIDGVRAKAIMSDAGSPLNSELGNYETSTSSAEAEDATGIPFKKQIGHCFFWLP